MKYYFIKKEKSSSIEIGLKDGDTKHVVAILVIVPVSRKIKEIELKFNHRIISVEEKYWNYATLKAYRTKEALSSTLVGKSHPDFLLRESLAEEDLV
jgi:hypothetical protein